MSYLYGGDRDERAESLEKLRAEGWLVVRANKTLLTPDGVRLLDAWAERAALDLPIQPIFAPPLSATTSGEVEAMIDAWIGKLMDAAKSVPVDDAWTEMDHAAFFAVGFITEHTTATRRGVQERFGRRQASARRETMPNHG